MQKVVGEIFKSMCGRRLLEYYWFSILVPSSHLCVTVLLWSTGAPGCSGRSPWNKQETSSQHWYHHPMPKGGDGKTWKKCLHFHSTPPSTAVHVQREHSATVPNLYVFPYNWQLRWRAKRSCTMCSTCQRAVASGAAGGLPVLQAGVIAASGSTNTGGWAPESTYP